MKLKYVFSSLGILICLSVFADGVKPAKSANNHRISICRQKWKNVFFKRF